MFKKFLSRKFLSAVVTGILDIAVATGYLPVEGKTLFIELVNGLAGLYITVEGIIDLIKKEKIS